MHLKLKSNPAKKDWLTFIDIALLVSGALLLGVGIIFFIAYNWDNMGKFFKISLVELSLITAFAFYYFSKNSTISKVSLYIATLLIGALLALIGQIYQMSADSYELFLYWALLIIPFSTINKDKTLWIITITLFNISLILYYSIDGLKYLPWISNKLSILFIFNLSILAIWEFISNIYNSTNSWQRVVLILYCNISLITLLFDTKIYNLIWYLPYFIVIYLYYFKKEDLTILIPTAIAFLLYVLIAISKVINWQNFWFIGLLILAATSLILGGYLIKLLQNIAGEKDV